MKSKKFLFGAAFLLFFPGCFFSAEEIGEKVNHVEEDAMMFIQATGIDQKFEEKKEQINKEFDEFQKKSKTFLGEKAEEAKNFGNERILGKDIEE